MSFPIDGFTTAPLLAAGGVAIDWTTLVAQVVNFLILVWLLKRFLYGPITTAMQRRAEAIAGQHAEAAERRAEAERDAARQREQLAERERTSEEMLARARAEAERERADLLREARTEVERQRGDWQEALVREQDAIRDRLRVEIGQRVTALAARALTDLADHRLQEQVVDVFLGRLADEDATDGDALLDLNGAGELLVRTTFELSAATCERIEAALRSVLPTSNRVRFETTGDLVCGIRLSGGGHVVEWSIDEYLADVRAELETSATAGDSQRPDRNTTAGRREHSA